MLHRHEILPEILVLDDVKGVVGNLGGLHRRQDRGLRHARVLLHTVVLVVRAKRNIIGELKNYLGHAIGSIVSSEVRN